MRDQQEHLNRRKNWNRALSTAALKELMTAMNARVTQLVEGIANQKGEVDMSQLVSFFTYDFMCDMA